MYARSADRNLLFGILALQMDFVARDDLIAAMNAWVLDKARPLGQVLMDQGALRADTHALLDALVDKHLAQHGNDPERSLAALSSLGSARETLRQIDDADLQASLARAGANGEGPLEQLSTVGAPPTVDVRFRILRPHAKGGLGEVFVAEDRELHREVALKEIQSRQAGDPRSRQRFLLEAEITGGLEHPGIVPVYGLGCYSDGRPFYAMRFIRGESLQAAIARFHRTMGSSAERNLGFRSLLRRFVDVCNAVAYAHSRGVMHRDLKPSNIMLGKYGETLVVDWGLAKTVGSGSANRERDVVDEQTLHPSPGNDLALTVAGAVIGTPQFMSPEQAAGRLELLGPTSDVYSLGATLYSLLTGRPPFDEGETGALLAQVCRGEFPPPRQRDSSVPRPLEAICLRAMAMRPDDRYPSARALADDIEHWLADEPTAAYPEPWLERLSRWARRRRTFVASALVAFVLLVVAGLGGLFLWETAEQRRRQQVEQHRSELRQAAETQEQLGISELQAGRFASAEKIFRQASEQLGEEPLLAELRARLDGRHTGVARLIEADRLASRAERYLVRNLDQAAIPNFEASLAAFGVTEHADWWQHLPDELTAAQKERLRRDLHIRLLTLGGLHARKGLMNPGDVEIMRAGCHAALPWIDAAQRYERCYTGDFMAHYCQVALGEAGLSDLRLDAEPQSATDFAFMGLLHAWIGRQPADPITRFALTRVRGVQIDSKTPLATAERHLRTAISLDPGNYWTYLWLGLTLQSAKQPESAELAYSAMIGLRPDSCAGYCYRALVVLDQIKPEDERQRRRGIRRALADLDAAVTAEPRNWWPHSYRASAYMLERDTERAIADLTTAIRCGPEPGDPDPLFYTCYEERGAAYHARGQHDEAIADLTEAIRLCPQRRPGELADLYESRGNTLARTRDYERALGDINEAIKLRPRATQYVTRGEVRYEQGKFDEALADYAEAVRLDPKYDSAYRARGNVLNTLGRYKEAIHEWDRAIELSDGPVRQDYRVFRALSRALDGQHEAAIAEVKEVAGTAQREGVILYDAAHVYYALATGDKDPAQADAYARECVALLVRARDVGYFKDPEKLSALKQHFARGPVQQRDDFRKLVAALEGE